MFVEGQVEWEFNLKMSATLRGKNISPPSSKDNLGQFC